MGRIVLGHKLQEHVVNKPLLTTPRRATALMGIVARELNYGAGRLVRAYAGGAGGSSKGGSAAAGDDGDGAGDGEGPILLADLAASAPRMSGPRDDRKVFRVVDGVAIVPVEGDLVHKLGTLDPWCGMTGYDAITFKVNEAAADPDVRGILLDIDSPGGMVDGCAACGDVIRAARAAKPVWAALSDNAFSAAYWLASQAERIVLPRTGGVGSVGVVTLHADLSAMYSEWGVTITVLHAGAHKADGHPYGPLPEAVAADILAELESLRIQFATAVAEGRGLGLDAVLATEARCLLAEDGVKAGFADEILNPDDALAAFIESLSAPSIVPTTPAAQAAVPARKGEPMATKPNAGRAGLAAARSHLTSAKPKAAEGDDEDKKDEPAAAEPEDEEGEDKSAADDPPPPAEEEDEEDDEEDAPAAKGDEDKDKEAKARKAAKARIKAIVTAPEAKGRDGLAQKLAFDTDLDPKAAIGLLAAAPATSDKASGFAALMAAHSGPALGAGAPDATPAAGLSAAMDKQLARMGVKPKGAA